MIALDLFAGTGWGVACQRLGIDEYGVENMPEAIATREANGMKTIYEDVWDGLEVATLPLGSFPWEASYVFRHLDLLIASPPCQTFSMAGKGVGRAALDEVLEAIAERAYLDPAALKAFGEKHDDKTALVLTPLAYIARDLPRIVVLEQVPTVLPAWEAYAEVMRGWGYSVKVAVLNAEQYGVPQTRKRAILVARWDTEANLPTPTHSRYYPTDPTRLDPDVKPWISMAEALGWGMDARPYLSIAPGTGGGGTDPMALGGSGARRSLQREKDSGHWVHPEGHAINLDPNKPATTVAADPRLSSREHHYHGEQNSTSTRVTAEEAAALQSYPEGFTFSGAKGKQFLQIGNAVPPLLAEAILKAATA